MKSYFKLALCVLAACQSFLMTAYAKPEWPSYIEIQAEGGVVIDADTGTVLYGQNIHATYPPASVAKLLTALVVIEYCGLDEMVTFSHGAVYDMMEGSGNPLHIEAGDTLSVEDCLYGLLLCSSDQAANALAEYVAGSRETFAEMMNEKAASLGCEDSCFTNPSGQEDPGQYTSSYDMAVIARAAYADSKLLEISSTLSRRLPPTKLNPDGITVRTEHRMLTATDPDDVNYYEGAVAGKTGYAVSGGFTSATYASRGGRNLIAVVLKSDRSYYRDTKAMLDFGFDRFQNLNIADYETDYVTGDEPVVIGGTSYRPSELRISPDLMVTVPVSASFSDSEKTLTAGGVGSDSTGAVAWVQYTYDDRKVGYACLYAKEEEPAAAASVEYGVKRLPPGGIAVWTALCITGFALLML